jgi:hypothetical protein
VEAAEVMSSNSGSMQLRYLQTLADMSNNNSSTIVFPLPMEIMNTFMNSGKSTGKGGFGGVSGDGETQRPGE